MSQIRMFIRFANDREFEIPVIPENISISDGGEFTRINVLGMGEIALPAFRKPQQISFSSFFPYQYDPTYCQYSPLLHPVDATDLFTRAHKGTFEPGKPDIIRFTMIEEYEAGLWVTWISDDYGIEAFQKEHKFGSLVDQFYTITLKSAQVPTLQVVGSIDDPNTQKPKHIPTPKPLGEDGTKTGDTITKYIRMGISIVNLRLKNGQDISDVTGPVGTGPDSDNRIIATVITSEHPRNLGFSGVRNDPTLGIVEEDIPGQGIILTR